MKNKLAYSELTDTVYWIDGKGGRHECTQNFLQVVLLWLTEGTGLPPIGEKYNRTLTGSKHNIEIDYEVKSREENHISPHQKPNL